MTSYVTSLLVLVLAVVAIEGQHRQSFGKWQDIAGLRHHGHHGGHGRNRQRRMGVRYEPFLTTIKVFNHNKIKFAKFKKLQNFSNFLQSFVFSTSVTTITY